MNEDSHTSEDFLVELEQVRLAYAQTGEVLRGVDLTVRKGETLAIVGPSGSGKSTLLNVISGLDRPTAGRAKLLGQELSELGDEAVTALRGRHIGFVFQQHHLLPQLTAIENVLLPMLAATNTTQNDATSRATSLLERVGLADRTSHRPSQLSGGECQRVAVVRALIQQPKLVLADEPTGSLDGASADALADLLLQLNREEGVAMVVVTHAMPLAERMSRALRLHEGVLLTPNTAGARG